MCGIAGIVRLDGGPIEPGWLDRAEAAIAHRGLDGSGRFARQARCAREASIGLVHCRLSIIDLADGRQPMVSRDKTIAVVFNGCIYNHRQLRHELVQHADSGHEAFVTDHSDTEVLLHGYRAWGIEGLLDRLEGMFACAIWDANAMRVILARDRAGEKPLYYKRVGASDEPSAVVFGSTMPAVAVLAKAVGGPGKIEVDVPELHRAIRRGWCGPEAMPLKGFCAVLPGCFVTAGKQEDVGPARRYWHPPTAAQRIESGTPLDVDRVDALLRASVEARLEADVPLGCFLSGGVDSSLVAHYAWEALGGSLKTFTVRMPMAEFDESAYAQEVASHLQTEHETLDVRAKPAEDLSRLIEHLGQPFGDSSILPTYWVSATAGTHVKAALAGDGGDELFIGYERLVAAEWLPRHGSKMRLVPLRGSLLSRFGPKSRWNKAGRLLDAARSASGYLDLVHVFPERAWRSVMPNDRSETRPPPVGIEQALAYEFGNYLPDDLLRKVDTASMAVPLEVRSPFLDRAVMEAGLGATVASLMSGENGRRGRKGLLRAVAAKHLPSRVAERRKMGFAIPIGQWFRTNEGSMRSLLLDTLKPGGSELAAYGFSRDGVRAMLNAHMNGRGSHEQRLFALLTAVLWLRWLKRL